MDILRVLCGYLLNIHAAVGTGQHHQAAIQRIDGNGQVDLPADAGQFLHQHLIHLQPLGARLVGNQVLAEQLSSELFGFVGRAHDSDTPGRAPSARVHLGLQQRLASKVSGGPPGLRRRTGDRTGRNRNAVAPEYIFGLILVNFHRSL